jgi:hypothetical protein
MIRSVPEGEAAVRTGPANIFLPGPTLKVVVGPDYIWCFPWNELSRVNLKTQRVLIEREGKNSSITKDGYRVDASIWYDVISGGDLTDSKAIVRTARAIDYGRSLNEIFEDLLVAQFREAIAYRTFAELMKEYPGPFRPCSLLNALKKSAAKQLWDDWGLELRNVLFSKLQRSDFVGNTVFDQQAAKKKYAAHEPMFTEKPPWGR